ncbi:unnamed protein product (macronuclear) [Paramecium tetraurelia]|uniref:Uncharacterized protein n=1 Tax=Paramecium tetraurelia TaxID=5888 RepID=A0BYC5_PARTE|nr:uncharacterized protein GSPATT00033395001 [Paramecium tetraurelia]CAK63542.1 unnamed protein product [Paramecium tetraurelia]|eukprot:XP_001430940.1 hypothetical protein (macronuclear) [Paramecium tetraurelia strain d4-2]
MNQQLNQISKLNSNKKNFQSKLNKCNSYSGANKIRKLKHYCHGSINSINIYAKYSAQNNLKELTLTTIGNSISIVQKVRNRSTKQEPILLVEFFDV